jgi:hypothetical protein
VTVLPPDVVTPIVDEADYSQIIGWRVTEIHPHPDKPATTMTIIDEYYADRRVRIKRLNGAQFERTEYPNLIGRVPVVHIPNNQGSNAAFGEAEGGALHALLLRYNTILEAALTGNEHQGRPTPVTEFESVDQMNAFIDLAKSLGLIQSETVTHPDGSTETFDTFNFDSEKFMMLAGGKFRYEQPGSFAKDTEILLGLLFYLFLQHTEIPEFAWGNAIASSKASAETQMLPFVKWIEKKRAACSGWMIELAQIVLGYYALIETGIQADDRPVIGWQALTENDDTLTLEAVKWGFTEGLLDEETALKMLPLDIQDPKAVLKQARKEREERQQASMERMLDEEQRAQDAQQDEDDPAAEDDTLARAA